MNKIDELYNSGLKLSFYHVISKKTVSFKAFITELQDSFKQDWNKEKSIGRYDPWHNFEGNERVINIGWKVIAESLEEAKDNLRKAGLLAQMGYARYDTKRSYGTSSTATAITEAPTFRLKLMNLIASTLEQSAGAYDENVAQAGLPGRIEGGFTFVHNIEEGYLQDDTGVYPKSISITCQYEVLHEQALGWDVEDLFRGYGFPYGQEDESDFVAGAEGMDEFFASEEVGEITERAGEIADSIQLMILGER